MSESRCQAPRCLAGVDKFIVLCRTCWRIVPTKLRSEFNSALKAMRACESKPFDDKSFMAYRKKVVKFHEIRRAVIKAVVEVG